MYRTLLLASSLAAAGACSTMSAQTQGSFDGFKYQHFTLTAGSPGGKAVFNGHCTSCHGDDGKGKAAIGTPDFTSSKIQASLSDADIVNTITNGRKGTIMPAWKGKLSEHEINAVASYVRSLGRSGGRLGAERYRQAPGARVVLRCGNTF
jgi:mono/diheme cytochrome c family protein